LFKKVFILVLIIPRILFIIGKYIFKLRPSADVNKNGKIYFSFNEDWVMMYTRKKL